MSLIRELKNLGATIAWSPTAREPSMLAIGTKEGAGTGFDNYGGELQVGSPGQRAAARLTGCWAMWLQGRWFVDSVPVQYRCSVLVCVFVFVTYCCAYVGCLCVRWGAMCRGDVSP
jgi:hypothetical protein